MAAKTPPKKKLKAIEDSNDKTNQIKSKSPKKKKPSSSLSPKKHLPPLQLPDLWSFQTLQSAHDETLQNNSALKSNNVKLKSEVDEGKNNLQIERDTFKLESEGYQVKIETLTRLSKESESLRLSNEIQSNLQIKKLTDLAAASQSKMDGIAFEYIAKQQAMLEAEACVVRNAQLEVMNSKLIREVAGLKGDVVEMVGVLGVVYSSQSEQKEERDEEVEGVDEERGEGEKREKTIGLTPILLQTLSTFPNNRKTTLEVMTILALLTQTFSDCTFVERYNGIKLTMKSMHLHRGAGCVELQVKGMRVLWKFVTSGEGFRERVRSFGGLSMAVNTMRLYNHASVRRLISGCVRVLTVLIGDFAVGVFDDDDDSDDDDGDDEVEGDRVVGMDVVLPKTKKKIGEGVSISISSDRSLLPLPLPSSMIIIDSIEGPDSAAANDANDGNVDNVDNTSILDTEDQPYNSPPPSPKPQNNSYSSSLSPSTFTKPTNLNFKGNQIQIQIITLLRTLAYSINVMHNEMTTAKHDKVSSERSSSHTSSDNDVESELINSFKLPSLSDKDGVDVDGNEAALNSNKIRRKKNDDDSKTKIDKEEDEDTNTNEFKHATPSQIARDCLINCVMSLDSDSSGDILYVLKHRNSQDVICTALSLLTGDGECVIACCMLLRLSLATSTTSTTSQTQVHQTQVHQTRINSLVENNQFQLVESVVKVLEIHVNDEGGVNRECTALIECLGDQFQKLLR